MNIITQKQKRLQGNNKPDGSGKDNPTQNSLENNCLSTGDLLFSYTN